MKTKKNMPQSLGKKILWTVIIVITVSFLCNRIFFFQKGSFGIFISNITYPAIWIGSKLAQPFKSFGQNRQNHQELLAKYNELKEKYENLLFENIKLNSTLYYAQQTQELSEFKKRYNLQTAIPCKILVKHFADNEHYFLIDKGQTHGIEKNMIAVYKFQLLGRVAEVFRWFSKVVLITDQHCKVTAYTNTTNTPGIVKGNNTINKCNLEYVNKLAPVEINDLVISSGQGMVFPEGFCLGQITGTQTVGLSQKIEIAPLVDLKSLNYCLLTNQEKITDF